MFEVLMTGRMSKAISFQLLTYGGKVTSAEMRKLITLLNVQAEIMAEFEAEADLPASPEAQP
ncbi:MAG: hypothetical protein Q7T86_03365 [Hyphomicrobiaceae bacterium]|nr:hypothetical protein [Hyphomicrobiaceae bacterium]